ncbi:hypothetical protein AB0E01_10375 [Nocardia vinacea]
MTQRLMLGDTLNRTLRGITSSLAAPTKREIDAALSAPAALMTSA